MSNYSTKKTVAKHEKLKIFLESAPSNQLKNVFFFLAPKIELTSVIVNNYCFK